MKNIFTYAKRFILAAWTAIGRLKYGNWVRYPVAIVLGVYILSQLGWYIVRPVYQWTTASYIEVQVLDKFVKQDRYYVSFKKQNGKEFNAVVEDSWVWLTWNASDRYRDLKVGKTMWVKVAGLRWDFMSWFPNVVRVKENG